MVTPPAPKSHERARAHRGGGLAQVHSGDHEPRTPHTHAARARRADCVAPNTLGTAPAWPSHRGSTAARDTVVVHQLIALASHDLEWEGRHGRAAIVGGARFPGCQAQGWCGTTLPRLLSADSTAPQGPAQHALSTARAGSVGLSTCGSLCKAHATSGKVPACSVPSAACNTPASPCEHPPCKQA